MTILLLIFGVPAIANDHGIPPKEQLRVGYFGPEWHMTAVDAQNGTFSLWDETLPVWVVAYGWKHLGTERIKAEGAPWYSLGDKHFKWAWRVVVRASAGEDESTVYQLSGELLSEDGFMLDRFFWNDGEDVTEFLEVIDGVETFNMAEHKGEGSPARLSMTMGSREQSYREKAQERRRELERLLKKSGDR